MPTRSRMPIFALVSLLCNQRRKKLKNTISITKPITTKNTTMPRTLASLSDSVQSLAANRALANMSVPFNGSIPKIVEVQIDVLEVRLRNLADEHPPGFDVDTSHPRTCGNHDAFAEYIDALPVEIHRAGWPKIGKGAPV